jgi:hypothetical protein
VKKGEDMTNKSKRLPPRDGESEIDQLKELIENLQGEIDNIKSSNEDESEKTRGKYLDNRLDIRPDARIKVLSLCPYELNLSTERNGRGRIYSFREYGEVKNIRYNDLADIIEIHRNFLEDGFFVILDNDIIDMHGLEEAYGKILTEENIDGILNDNYSDAIKLFETANKRQQENIAAMFVKKIMDNESVNLNFVDQISRVVGYNIKEKAEESLKTLETYKQSSKS